MREEEGNPGVGAEPGLFAVQRRPGDLFFAGVLFVLALFLLSRLPAETRWFERVALPLQPRFWPAIVLGAFAFFSGPLPAAKPASHGTRPFVARLRRRQRRPRFRMVIVESPSDRASGRRWPASCCAGCARWNSPCTSSPTPPRLPWLGYLLSTAAFMPLLGLRTGIRSLSGLGLLAGLGIGIVLVFKTGLEVRMPPGALYDLFPPQVRNFLIRNF